jgi:hypothetical protein
VTLNPKAWLTRWRRPHGRTIADVVEDATRAPQFRVPPKRRAPPRVRFLAQTLDAGISRPLDI